MLKTFKREGGASKADATSLILFAQSVLGLKRPIYLHWWAQCSKSDWTKWMPSTTTWLTGDSDFLVRQIWDHPCLPPPQNFSGACMWLPKPKTKNLPGNKISEKAKYRPWLIIWETCSYFDSPSREWWEVSGGQSGSGSTLQSFKINEKVLQGFFLSDS